MVNFDKIQTSDLNNEKEESEMSFDVLYNKYAEETISSEKIHQVAHIEIRGRDGEINHEIDILNENPEVNIEDYAERIEKVISRSYKIHPEIIKNIRVVDLSEYGKELFDENNPEREINEKKAKEGLLNGANANRFDVNVEKKKNIYDGIRLGYRSFKNIQPRHIIDNTGFERKSNISHFEMILAHELFHQIGVLSQYEDDKFRKNQIDESKKFDWMNDSGVNESKESLEFSGLLSSNHYKNVIDNNGEIQERWKKVLKLSSIKNKEGEDIKCQINNGNLLRPEKDIIYPERFVSNYAREQAKKLSGGGEEDFCDSMVVYAFDPEFLKEFDKKRGTNKFEWLEKRWGLYSKEKLDSPEIKMDIFEKK